MGVGTVRSRNGCKSCKKLRIKCDQKKPKCQNCIKRNIADCDYSLTLHWGGRPYKDGTKKVTTIPNTKIVDGVVTVKSRQKRNVSKAKSFQKSMVLINQNMGYKSRLPVVNNQISEITPAEQKQRIAVFDAKFETIVDKTFFNSLSVSPLRAYHLPSVLPEILTASPYYMELFDFYLRETCHLLVPISREMCKKNPFFVVLPQIAMQNSTLMYLLLAFGANHRNMMLAQSSQTLDILADDSPINSFFANWASLEFGPLDFLSNNLSAHSDSVTDELLSKAFKDLVQKLKDENERKSDGTLATVMMLAAYDIFFSDKRRKWRAHVCGARHLLKERLAASDDEAVLISNAIDESDSKVFLTRWFTYVDVIGSLSSTNRIITDEKFGSLKYEFREHTEEEYNRRLSLGDIECTTGLEPKVLSLLAEVSRIIREKESFTESDTQDNEKSDLLLQTLELDYKITKYLIESEEERDKIYELHFSSELNTDGSNPETYARYRMLRATNLIFGLTGSLQLKRRALNMPLESVVVKDLLVQISEIVSEHIPLASSLTSCVIFCLFCCGCDLLDESMIAYRPIYMNRIKALNQRGVSSAGMAKSLMEQCWAQNKSWWNILKENNLDITFAI